MNLPEIDYSRLRPTDWLPTSVKEMKALGWHCVDVVLLSGDAYVDHPAFGAAVIGRTLQAAGFRVAIVPQPNWQDDLRDFRKFGAPRLFFGVSPGAMDSMVNHYTAARRRRSDDAYTPGGRHGARPDYPSIVYSRILKELFPDVPVILGGIEASLRRLAHYDYWEDRLRPGILADAPADMLIYGMGERTVLQLARRLDSGEHIAGITDLEQTAMLRPVAEIPGDDNDNIVLAPLDRCRRSKAAHAANFKIIEQESNRYHGHKVLWQDTGGGHAIRVDPINLHRGCFGGCAFCTISAHQGKFIASRSPESILREARQVTRMPDFKGYISDLGGPSANMYAMGGKNREQCRRCLRP